MTNSGEALVKRARELGLRMTEPRKIILQVLAEAQDHPDAVELHRRIEAVAPNINLSTTYRTLSLLAEHGLIERHNFSDGPMRIETASQHHDHFIDVESGEIIEFQSAELERLQENLARQYGYEIVAHKLEIKVRKL